MMEDLNVEALAEIPLRRVKDGEMEEFDNEAIRPPIAIGATMEKWKNL
jgi:hypothetical protein